MALAVGSPVPRVLADAEVIEPTALPSGSAAGRAQVPAIDQTALPSGSAAGRAQVPAIDQTALPSGSAAGRAQVPAIDQTALPSGSAAGRAQVPAIDQTALPSGSAAGRAQVPAIDQTALPSGSAAGRAQVPAIEPASGTHRLGDTWRERDVVLVFVRHFACAGCAEHLAALRPRLDELATLAVDVVIVGNGSPDQLAAFVEREDIARPHVRCFTDPSLAAYRAAGLVRSRWGTLGPIALGHLGRAYLGGHRNGRPQGDRYQQGGTLYVTRAGDVAFYQRATSLGDHASLGDVVDIALAQRAGEAAIA